MLVELVLFVLIALVIWGAVATFPTADGPTVPASTYQLPPAADWYPYPCEADDTER